MIGFNETDLTREENNLRFRIINYKVCEKKVLEIWQQFENSGVRPIIIKGWAAAQFYPHPEDREFVDVDLMVDPEKFDVAEALIDKIKSPYPIDLHAGARHLDKLSFEELYAGSLMINCCDGVVRTLQAEDHLRILAIHWLTDGGANRNKLWDIYYGLKGRSINFNWDRFLDLTGNRRRRWIECAVGAAQKYLGLSLDSTPLEKASETLPDWFINALEKEWEDSEKLEPLTFSRRDVYKFLRQLKKRFPPNPIHATVLQEGDFDSRLRLFYQIANIISRSLSSLNQNYFNFKAKK